MNFEEHYFKDGITEEMEKFFEERTARHIGLVQKYGQKIADLGEEFSELAEIVQQHDQSKLEEPERTPYVFVTWQYKCKDDGTEFNPPADIKEMMSKATEHHVKNNAHHPEFHSPQEVDLINREDRDKPPEEMVDATQMPSLAISEMVADWCAMSEEKGNTPMEWADKNVNVRWKFTEDQKNLIYDLMSKVWE